MWGTKNFVSVRLYSAPQSHWTIVAIFGICALGEPVQAGSFAIKSGPPSGRGVLKHRPSGKLLTPFRMHIGLPMRPTYVDGNDVDAHEKRNHGQMKSSTASRTRFHFSVVIVSQLPIWPLRDVPCGT